MEPEPKKAQAPLNGAELKKRAQKKQKKKRKKENIIGGL